MALTSFPFDGQVTTEDQYSLLFRNLQDTGVVGGWGGSELKVSSNATGLKVQVAAGLALVRGHMLRSTAVEEVPISTAPSSGTRKDAIVARLDPAANTITLVAIPGDGAGNPPPLTQTDLGLYELLLAHVTVGTSVSVIAAGAVEDKRTYVTNGVGAWSNASRPASARLGQIGLNIDSGRHEWWNGSAWEDVFPNRYGTPGAALRAGTIVSDGTTTWMSDGSSWKVLARQLRAGALAYEGESTSVQSVTSNSTSGNLSPGAILTTTFTLPYAATIDVFAQMHIEPAGNAAGGIIVELNGTPALSRQWHSRATTNHQWPALSRPILLGAGTHTVKLYGYTTPGSVATNFDNAYLTLTERAQ